MIAIRIYIYSRALTCIDFYYPGTRNRYPHPIAARLLAVFSLPVETVLAWLITAHLSHYACIEQVGQSNLVHFFCACERGIVLPKRFDC